MFVESIVYTIACNSLMTWNAGYSKGVKVAAEREARTLVPERWYHDIYDPARRTYIYTLPAVHRCLRLHIGCTEKSQFLD